MFGGFVSQRRLRIITNNTKSRPLRSIAPILPSPVQVGKGEDGWGDRGLCSKQEQGSCPPVALPPVFGVLYCSCTSGQHVREDREQGSCTKTFMISSWRQSVCLPLLTHTPQELQGRLGNVVKFYVCSAKNKKLYVSSRYRVKACLRSKCWGRVCAMKEGMFLFSRKGSAYSS